MGTKRKSSRKGGVMSGDDAHVSKLHRKLKRYGTHKMKKTYSQNIHSRLQ